MQLSRKLNPAQQEASQSSNPCPILQVHSLSAGYPGVRQIIEQITFSVESGTRVAIIGPNGAGKSTLFKALVGIIPHESGHISINGENCQTSHNLMGYVPQSEEIDWNFPVSVNDVVMMGRERQIGWFKRPNTADKIAVKTALEKVQMDHLLNQPIGQLSGGQRRRVFIARALAQETNVLLLDEPFNGVDVTAEHEIMQTLDTLRNQGITVILATHDLAIASTKFDRILLIKHHVIAYGEPDEVFQPEFLDAAYGNRFHFHRFNQQQATNGNQQHVPR